MTVPASASIVGCAQWVDEARLPDNTLSSGRIARADRLTRLAAGVAGMALHGLSNVVGPRVAVLGGTVLASLATNERYERRRLRSARAAPRDFPYTAPNAWLGEVGTALSAQGPSLCLVGDACVCPMIVATASRWLALRLCDRALVVVAESPPQDIRLRPPQFKGRMDGAAALVLERVNATTPRLHVEPTQQQRPQPDCLRLGSSLDLHSSLEAMLRIVDGVKRSDCQRFFVSGRVGTSWWITVEGA